MNLCIRLPAAAGVVYVMVARKFAQSYGFGRLLAAIGSAEMSTNNSSSTAVVEAGAEETSLQKRRRLASSVVIVHATRTTLVGVVLL